LKLRSNVRRKKNVTPKYLIGFKYSKSCLKSKLTNAKMQKLILERKSILDLTKF